MKETSKIFIGTSGWKYKHWDNVFYPVGLKKTDQLEYYYSNFSTVELNNSFYKQPTVSSFESWKDSVPEDFVFAVKANRFFTHLKKLNVSSKDLVAFIDKAASLELKLGPILFQLPPRWNVNVERLANFLKILPKGYRFTFEFRNPTWYTEEVYRLLKKHNCAFCIYELAGHLSPLSMTADFVYVRLHGPGEKYQGSYTPTDLLEWKKHINTWKKKGKDVYVYFDNDQAGYAAFNAIELKKLVHA